MRFFEDFLNNRIFFIVLSAWLLSCVIKGIIECIKNKKIDWSRFFGPGGMPSSHSTIVCSLAVCVGIYEGFDSAVFVVCCALALIVMYDASGVRRAAGEQAKIINMIVDAWEERDPVLKEKKLKELLGHTPLEVLGGAILGVLFAVITSCIIGL
ncbi:MAG: divergent PAP2 family protein [Clostridiales bacterium]|nr:divergent PAP2 family protein [Clostridiales bacterium]